MRTMSSMRRVLFLVSVVSTMACGTRTISQGTRGDAGDAGDDVSVDKDAAPIVIPEVCSALPDRTKCPTDTHLVGRSGVQQLECAAAVARPKCGPARARLEACRNTDPFCYDDAGKIVNSPPDPCEKQRVESDACVEP
jgi:hypothetical protein